jgi:hypothetical protein
VSRPSRLIVPVETLGLRERNGRLPEGMRSPSRAWPRWVTPPDTGANLREVISGLYVGNEFSPTVRSFGVVIDLYGVFKVDPSRYGGHGRVVSMPFTDGEEMPKETIEKGLGLILRGMNSEKPTLVHCQAGLSRSASLAYGALRLFHKMAPDEALQRVSVPGYEGHYPRTKTLASVEEWVKKNAGRYR